MDKVTHVTVDSEDSQVRRQVLGFLCFGYAFHVVKDYLTGPVFHGKHSWCQHSCCFSRKRTKCPGFGMVVSEWIKGGYNIVSHV